MRVAISNLINRKAGHDNVTAEMLKASDNIAVTFFTQLFNKIFSEGVYLEQWSRSVIVPLFNRGDKDIPNNYRGILLQSVTSKCYTTVLRNRLTKWMDDHEKIVETEAGFRKVYFTIYIYIHLISYHREVFKQDSEESLRFCRPCILVPNTCKSGLSGPFLNAIKAVVSCVRVHNKVTDFFFFFIVPLVSNRGVF